jgi:hypothetical protein
MQRLPAVVAALSVAISALALSLPAAAHERRMVGPYQFVVGWLNEPAYQGEPNGATVRITDPRTNPAKAMEGLVEAISIEVRSGGLTTPFTGKTRAVFGQAGLYSLDLIPTASGAYTYRIRGKIESLEFDETFESGPGRFDDVKSQSDLQYPAKAPAGSELGERLASIERQLGTVQAVALVALALTVVFGIGTTLARRRT